MDSKEYFERLVELTRKLQPRFEITYTPGEPVCWEELFRTWNEMIMCENIFSPILRCIIFNKSPEAEDEKVQELYVAISEALLNSDEALLAWGSTDGMSEAIGEVCYNDLAEEGEESSEAFQRYLHCCLVEKLFAHRDPAKLFDQGHAEAHNTYIPHGYEYYVEYKQKYRDCTMRMFPYTDEWTESEWMVYDNIAWCFVFNVSLDMPVYMPDDVDAVYYYFLGFDGFDCKLSQHAGGMITADLNACKAFEVIFGNSLETMYNYVRDCLANKDCKLTLSDYKYSWIYYIINIFAEDKDDPGYKEAKRMIFDIQMMAST